MRTSGRKDLSQELMVVSGLSIDVIADSVVVKDLKRAVFCVFISRFVFKEAVGIKMGDKLGVVDLVLRVIGCVGGIAEVVEIKCRLKAGELEWIFLTLG